jgi:tRNA 2-thiouridine synthesizing protein A
MTAPGEPVIIDGGSPACRRLLLGARDRISGLLAGTVIHLTTSDPASPIDLPAWCHVTSHSYLGAIPAATSTYALRTIPRTCHHRPGFSLAPCLS